MHSGISDAKKSNDQQALAQGYNAADNVARAKRLQHALECDKNGNDTANRADLKRAPNQNGERPNAYRDGIALLLRERQRVDASLYFLDGLMLINDPLYLLVTDNVHPNDAGMHRIAEGVAAALKPILERLA